MGIEIELSSAPTKAENRTWRVGIDCAFDIPRANWSVIYHREVVPLDAQGKRAGAITQSNMVDANGKTVQLSVSANFAQLKDREFTAAGVTVTGAQMMALISHIGDALWQEKLDAGDQTPSPVPAPVVDKGP